MSNRTSTVVLTITALALAGALLSHAGPLDPPAGPVAPTYKTLTEVEPRIAINATNTPGDANSLFKITQPGSYYLTGNITGVAAKHGIKIVSGGVAIDLNGFDLVGIAGSLDGVSSTVANMKNVAVVNGSVRNWGGDGIDLETIFVTSCRVEGVCASGNGGNGLATGFGSTVTNCVASGNTSNGIFAANGSVVTNCSAYNNTLTGISVKDGSTVTSCAGYQNLGNGIFAQSGSTVSHCSADQNIANGISVGARNSIVDCTVAINTLDGILCPTDCVIRGNSCSFNGNLGDGAGIHATGGNNRIESNNCTGADRGIDIDLAGNLIVRNTCSGNTTDWVIVANNVFGPIIDRRAPASGGVNGFSATSSLGSTEPNANFSY